MNFTALTDTYAPSANATQIVRDARIVLLVGIAGAGKDTLKHHLLMGGGFRDIVSHTTRAPRINNGQPEVDGSAYHFIDDDRAAQLIIDGAFIEVKCVHGDTVYGTSIASLQAATEGGSIAVTDIDVQGVDEYKRISQSVVAIFILPPNYDEWRERLSRRYETDDEFNTEWPKRRTSAIAELETALSVPYYHFIINDDLTRTVRVAREIAERGDQFYRQDDEARLAARTLLDDIRGRD